MSAGQVAHSARGGRVIALAALLAAGLVLTHPRVALMFAALVLASLVADLAAQPRRAETIASAAPRLIPHALASPGRWSEVAGSFVPRLAVRWFRTALVASLAAGIVAPWLARLAGSRFGEVMIGVGSAPPTPFALPVYGDFDGGILALGGLGLLVGISRRMVAAPTLMLWVAFTWLLANPQAAGIPVFLYLSNHAVEIALFLPVALAVGLLIGEAARRLAPIKSHSFRRGLATLGLASVLVASGQQLDVVNPGTIRYTRGDVTALAWIAEHLPVQSRVLINATPWQGGVFVGTDGGYWIPTIAGRATTTPPVLYDGGSPAEVKRVRDVSQAIASWDGDPRELVELLRAHGVTHVYVGTGSGPLRPRFFLEHGYPVLYTNGRAWVFGVPW